MKNFGEWIKSEDPFYLGISIAFFAIAGLMLVGAYQVYTAPNRPVKVITTEGTKYFDRLEVKNDRCALAINDPVEGSSFQGSEIVICDYFLE